MKPIPADLACQPRASKVILPDMLWGLSLLAIITTLLIPAGYEIFIKTSRTHVYLMAFLKFAVLATMGELLALRILNGSWKKPLGLLWRASVWGFLGILIALVFFIYATGVSGALQSGLLPSLGDQEMMGRLAFAIFTSGLMNLLFAPTFMAFHRITDTMIDMGEGKMKNIIRLEFAEVLNNIDWNGFISFVVCKTIPLFWIPAHTITFLLPAEHRVFAAALLSIALGAILAFSKKAKNS